MLIHAPQPWDDFRGGNYNEGSLAAWRALEEAFHAGKLRAIGVSNFLEHDLDNILDNVEVAPHVNQIPDNPQVIALAEKYGVSGDRGTPLLILTTGQGGVMTLFMAS